MNATSVSRDLDRHGFIAYCFDRPRGIVAVKVRPGAKGRATRVAARLEQMGYTVAAFSEEGDGSAEIEVLGKR